MQQDIVDILAANSRFVLSDDPQVLDAKYAIIRLEKVMEAIYKAADEEKEIRL